MDIAHTTVLKMRSFETLVTYTHSTLGTNHTYHIRMPTLVSEKKIIETNSCTFIYEYLQRPSFAQQSKQNFIYLFSEFLEKFHTFHTYDQITLISLEIKTKLASE